MNQFEPAEIAKIIIHETGSNLFLTGKAGTGKTTLLKEIINDSPKNLVILAPTGVAAMNAGGMTIHSFFQLPFSTYIKPVQTEQYQNTCCLKICVFQTIKLNSSKIFNSS
jgi:GTPase SAR1 family protein